MWYPPLIHSVEKGNKVFKSYIVLMHTEHKRITESEQFVNFTQRQTDLKVKKESCEMSTDTMGYKLLWNQSHQHSNQFSKLILTNRNVLVWFFDICNESQKVTIYRINKLSTSCWYISWNHSDYYFFFKCDFRIYLTPLSMFVDPNAIRQSRLYYVSQQ